MSRLRKAVLALVVTTVLSAAFAGIASAHPLGNFTTNQLVRVQIDEGAAELSYVLDQAEIPTFQLIQRYGVDSAADLSEADRAAIEAQLLEEVESGLVVSADGTEVSLGAPSDVALEFGEGQGGLDLIRLEASLSAPLPADVDTVEVENGAFDGRRGWQAVQAVAGEGTDVDSSVPASDPTEGLRVYPQDLLSTPSDVRTASLEVSAGDGELTAPASLDGRETTTDRADDGFANSLAGGDTSGILILFLLAAAFGWGALHALSPGHGKAMVAGYLVGARGTPRHAVILGVTVTATHTASVFLLGAITLAASQYILPEDLYPWLGVASGLMVVAIGATVMRSRFLRWREMRALAVAEERVSGAVHGHSHVEHDHVNGHGGEHAHDHDQHDHIHEHALVGAHAHEHAHAHGHAHPPTELSPLDQAHAESDALGHHDHDHEHHHDHDHTHSHGGHTHSHMPEGPITMRSLIALGVSGGIVPCPSALVVLIAAISQHRIGFGMLLILVFSLGLAATMTAVGLAVIWSGRLINRHKPETRLFGGRFAGALPALSASIIIVAGILISVRAIPELTI